MTLSDCPHCGHRVSSGTSVCPKCDAPLHQDLPVVPGRMDEPGIDPEPVGDASTGSVESSDEGSSSGLPTWLLLVLVFVGGSVVLVAGVVAVVVVAGSILGEAEGSVTAADTTTTVTMPSGETTTTAAEPTTTSVPTTTTSLPSTTTSVATTTTSATSTTATAGSGTEAGESYPSGIDLIFSSDVNWSDEGGWISDYLYDSSVGLVIKGDGTGGFTEDGTAVGGWDRLAINGVTTDLIVIDRACIDSECTNEILYLADDGHEFRRSVWVLVDDENLFSQALTFEFRESEGDGQACWSRSNDGPVVSTTDGSDVQRAWVYTDGDAGEAWYIADLTRLDREVISTPSMGLFDDWIQC